MYRVKWFVSAAALFVVAVALALIFLPTASKDKAATEPSDTGSSGSQPAGNPAESSPLPSQAAPAFSGGYDSSASAPHLSAAASTALPSGAVATGQKDGPPTVAGKRRTPQATAEPDVADLLADADLTNPAERERVAMKITQQEEVRRLRVVEKAKSLGVPEVVKKPEGGISEIFDFEGDQPIYRTTFNSNAGVSSGASMLRGGGFDNLTANGLTVGVWDGGLVRPTHQEFAEEQVALRNPERSYNDHATHVAATLAAIGYQPDAQGMAPEAKVDSYFWRNDHGEMTLAGARLSSGESGKIPISNHSYGIMFLSGLAGHYERLARANDAVAYHLPYYLQFWAAGNSQRWAADGYFTMSHYQLAKNIVTVGAVEDAVDSSGKRDPALAEISDFSSFGPVKDGRIKPDLVASGVSLYSAIDFSDQSYDTYSGTSMASPSAAGTAALLVQLYQRENNGRLPLASLLKAVLIHTADDRGRPGPDYQYGWGLIDGQAAGDLIRENKTSPRFFAGSVDAATRRWSHTFKRNGTTPVRATLVWSDPPGEVRSMTSREPNLVHNLDLMVLGPDGTTEHLPYSMPYVGNWTTEMLEANAVRGKNDTDNVEQVNIDGGASGEYTIVVTADGSLSAGQDFSVVLTGSGTPVNARPVVNLQLPESGRWFLPGRKIAMTATATDLQADGSPGTVTKLEFLVNGVLMGEDAAPPYEFSDWTPAPGNYRVEAKATDSEGAVGYSNPATVSVRDPLPGEVHPAFIPPSANNAIFALAEDDNQQIYIGGLFTMLNGSTQAQRIARLGPNGDVDTAGFAMDAGPDDRVRVLAFNSGQKAIYVGGDFARIGATPRRALARLHVGQNGTRDGTLDAAFVPDISSSHPLVKTSVRAILVQSDGKILVGGLFDRINGQVRRNLARLHADGTLDEGFNPDPNGAVDVIVIQPDGKILIGGEFTALGSVVRNRLARVDANGFNDSSLVLGTGQQTGFNGPVHAVAVDGGGAIFVGGSFTAYRGHPFHSNLVKLDLVGALKGYFNAQPGLNGSVYDIISHGGGKLLASGSFTAAGNNLLEVDETEFGRIVQFTNDGNFDPAFNTGGVGANGAIHRALRLSSGHLLVAGAFSEFNKTARARLALIAGAPASPAPLPTKIVSRWQSAAKAGHALDVRLPSERTGSSQYHLEGDLPVGLRFDAHTGRLSGVPLSAGNYEVRITSVGAGGTTSESVLELQVDEAVVSYEQWKSAWFGPDKGARAEPYEVNNSAGYSNFEIYALSGGDPRAPNFNLLPKVEVVRSSNGQHRATLHAGKFSLANFGGTTNVVYQVEGAPTLSGPWHALPIEDDGSRLRVLAEVPGGQQFFRIRLLHP